MITVDAGELERARLELRGMVRDYLFNPDYKVGLIDFGFPQHTTQLDGRDVQYWDPESVALRFHVPQKFKLETLAELGLKPLPRRIGPFVTDVIEAEYGSQLPFGFPSGPATARREKLCGGLGIWAFRNYNGTLGGIVRDRVTRKPMMLSNWHVLYVSRNTRPGQPVYQPIRLFNNGEPARVARVSRERLSAPAASQLPLDAAVAELLEGALWENYQLGIGRVTGAARPALGMTVVKAGLSSGVTRGVITGVEGFSKKDYELGDWSRLIERGVTISRAPLGTLSQVASGRPRDIVSVPGDSGAWWLDVATRQAVALNFAGLSNGTRALGIDMPFVLDELGVDVAVELA